MKDKVHPLIIYPSNFLVTRIYLHITIFSGPLSIVYQNTWAKTFEKTPCTFLEKCPLSDTFTCGGFFIVKIWIQI